SDAVSPGAGVHASAMTFGVNASDDAVFIEWQLAEVSEFAGEQCRLIKTAFAFAFGMKRNGNDPVSGINWVALLRCKHQTRQTRSDALLAFQLKYRSPQCSFVKSDCAGCGECVIVTLAAADTLSSVFVNLRAAKCAALPAQRVVVSEHSGRAPARSTGDAVSV